jgi:ADP-ribosylation factor-like protein 2
MKNLNTNDLLEDTIKIVLIGLDNSGKSSILKCLMGIKHISAFNSPQPTRGDEWESFEKLNSNYTIVDLGGQKAFRDEYLNDFDKYLTGTRKIIYVIDVQDIYRYDEALKYLESVINSIDKKNKINFSIFLHKFDPDIKFDKVLNEKVINDLINKIKETLPPNITYSLYKTSIFAIFEKSTIT